jgi:branched-chain amino acid transport system permease protein
MIAGDAKSHTLVPSLVIAGTVTAAGLVLPIDSSLEYTLIIALSWAVAAVGLDVLVGFTGQVSFGQAAFVGLGAYATSTLRLQLHLPTPLAVILGVGIAALISFALGSVVLRYKLFGVAIATLFFGYVIVTALRGEALAGLIGGSNGMAVPEFEFVGGAGKTYLAVTGIVLILVVIATCQLMNSRTGRALRLIKANDAVAESAGIRVRQTKMIAFVYCAVLAGISGVLYSGVVGYLGPDTFGVHQSINIFAMLVVGGAGTVGGPILGALLVTILPGYFLRDGHVSSILSAAVLLIFLILLPEGIYGVLQRVGAFFVRRLPWLRPRVASGGAASASDTAAEPVRLRRADDAAKDIGGAPALEISNVEVRFGEFVALSDVTVQVEAGSVHAIVGPNGAGKTTLLNAVSALNPLSAGHISFFGERADGATPHEIRRRGVVRTFQTPAIVPDLSVIDNVKLGLDSDEGGSFWADMAGPLATRRKERVLEAEAGWALDAVNIAPARRTLLARNLDLSEQKRVELARGLVARARLLLLDEPTAGLSSAEMEHLAQTLKNVHQLYGLTIVLISHHVGFILDIADALTVLDFGKVIGSGDPQSVLARPEIASTFLGIEQAEEVAE